MLGLLSKVIRSRTVGTANVKKISVFIVGGIGDGIMALPALKALANSFAGASVTLVTNRSIKDLVDTTLTVGKWIPIHENRRIISSLLQEKFDVVFVNVVGVHHTVLLVHSLLSKASYRLGPKYSHERFSCYTSPYPVSEDKHDAVQNLEMLAPVGIEDDSYPALNFPHNTSERLVVGIHPGGDRRQKIRRWPAYKFGQLINVLCDRYGAELVLFEGEDEPGLCSEIVGAVRELPLWKDIKIVRGKPIKEVCTLIGGCSLFVTSDSGLGHIADAIGVPTITIFGPANPKRTAPFRSQDNVVYHGLPCGPCYATTGCRFVRRKCLEEIGVAEVAVEVEKCLKNIPQVSWTCNDLERHRSCDSTQHPSEIQ